MELKYFDAHCHIQFEDYAQDQADIIARMKARGVAGVVVGCDLESSKKAVALAGLYPHLYASVGLHPNRVGQEVFDEAQFRTLAGNPKVVAIGECGLDYYRPAEVDDAVKLAQKEVLQQHFALAAAFDKPLIIHARPAKGTQDAYHDLVVLLTEANKKYPNLRGDVHFFVGGFKEAEQLFALGFTISFTAVITFARDYDAVIRAAPLANILSETDAPYVAPLARRGKRNDPLAVQDVVAKVAEIRAEDLEVVRAALLDNSQRLFNIPAPSA